VWLKPDKRYDILACVSKLKVMECNEAGRLDKKALE